MEIKEKLTTIFFCCALLAIVGGENARAIDVKAGGPNQKIICSQNAADELCSTACANAWSGQWSCNDTQGLMCGCKEPTAPLN